MRYTETPVASHAAASKTGKGMHFLDRLDILIPGLILGVFLLTAIIAIHVSQQWAYSQTQVEVTRHLQDRITFLQGATEEFLKLGMRDRLQQLISSFAADRDLVSVHIVGDQGEVLAANRFADIGNAWQSLQLDLDQTRIEHARQTQGTAIYHDADKGRLETYASICVGGIALPGPGGRCGFISYRIDLQPHMLATTQALKKQSVYYILGMSAVVVVILALLHIFIAERSERIASILKEFGGGDRSARVTISRQDELSDLSRSVNQLLDKIARDEKIIRDGQERQVAMSQQMERAFEDLSVAHEQLEQRARTDKLTTLYNRGHFDEVMCTETLRATRHRTTMSLMMVDVDYFKRFNDRYGHPEGDRCLQEIAGAMREVFMRSGEVVARYGGEEFVVILPHCEAKEAVSRADRLLQTVMSRRIAHEASSVAACVTVSIGVVTYRPESVEPVNPSTLVKVADEMLYQAKSAGRNQVRHRLFYTESGPRQVHKPAQQKQITVVNKTG